MNDREAQLLTALKALISDIESMHNEKRGWFGPFSEFKDYDYYDSRVSVEWPNLAISLEEAKKQVSYYNGMRE